MVSNITTEPTLNQDLSDKCFAILEPVFFAPISTPGPNVISVFVC